MYGDCGFMENGNMEQTRTLSCINETERCPQSHAVQENEAQVQIKIQYTTTAHHKARRIERVSNGCVLRQNVEKIINLKAIQKGKTSQKYSS